MAEYFRFVLTFPLAVLLILFIGATFADPSLALVIFHIYGWPFGDGCSEDLFSRKFARRLGITILCWFFAGTAAFCWMKWR